MYPHRVRSIVPIATCMQATAQQIAWGAIGRRAIRLDPAWRGGDYYDAAPGDGPARGSRDRPDGRPGDVPQRQRVHRPVRPRARRHAPGRRHARHVAAVRGRALPRVPRHKLVRRFDTNSYLRHRQGDGPPRHRPRAAAASQHAMARIAAPALAVGISSDMLYPTYQQRQIAETAARSAAVGRVRRDRLAARPRRVPDQRRPARRPAGAVPRRARASPTCRSCRRDSRPRSGAPRSR